MPDPYSQFGTRVPTPQMERDRADEVKNSAGGYVFTVSPTQRLLRFLVLGTDGGTYYVSERDLTKQNYDFLRDLFRDNPSAVDTIVDVSLAGRAPRQNATMFALALASASFNVETRRKALAAVPSVCRTGTMLFLFVRYARQFRGWGRGLRDAVGRGFYALPPAEKVAFQAIKYRSREGYTHRDVLRLSHPVTNDPAKVALFDWLAGHPGKNSDQDLLPPIIRGYEAAQAATTTSEWVSLIHEFSLPWEALPDAALRVPEVWEALIPHLGLTALIRNLGRMTNIGLVAPFAQATKEVVARLGSPEDVRRSRIHPLNVLFALSTYRSGGGFRGKMTWNPVPQISDALEEVFYSSFGNVAPANKRTLLALDVSSSMDGGSVGGTNLTPREVAGAMAMVTARSEPDYLITAFAGKMVPLDITAKDSLTSVVHKMKAQPFGPTDCALPMAWANKQSIPVDTFVVLTDNETWAGGSTYGGYLRSAIETGHPHQELESYRRAMGIPARQVVVGMTATNFTIADPNDPLTLDVVGVDTATPDLISGFSRGEF